MSVTVGSVFSTGQPTKNCKHKWLKWGARIHLNDKVLRIRRCTECGTIEKQYADSDGRFTTKLEFKRT